MVIKAGGGEGAVTPHNSLFAGEDRSTTKEGEQKK